MATRLTELIINKDDFEKIDYNSFVNETNISFTPVEIYISQLIRDELKFDLSELNPSIILDEERKSIRKIVLIQDSTIFCYDDKNLSLITIPKEKVLILPLWHEIRIWFQKKKFKLEYHFDPSGLDEDITLGLIKPKFISGGDIIIIETFGKTDLEASYKAMYELIKYEQEPEENGIT